MSADGDAVREALRAGAQAQTRSRRSQGSAPALAALARLEAAEQQRDALAEALADEPEKWSYETLIRIAELILARDYPPDIFPDAAPEGSTDIGPAFVPTRLTLADAARIIHQAIRDRSYQRETRLGKAVAARPRGSGDDEGVRAQLAGQVRAGAAAAGRVQEGAGVAHRS